MDFCNINKVCQHDEFHLPNIDMLVDATVVTQCFLSWIVSMAIITSRWKIMMLRRLFSKLLMAIFLYSHDVWSKKCRCYLPVQWLPFHDKLHVFLEDYVDDIAVKSREVSQHIDDLRKVFLSPRWYHLKINNLKCDFSVSSSKILRVSRPQKRNRPWSCQNWLLKI